MGMRINEKWAPVCALLAALVVAIVAMIGIIARAPSAPDRADVLHSTDILKEAIR